MNTVISGISRFSVITGHYGSGKTNIALNLAFQLKQAGHKVTLIDLDIVNPYFRTADHRDSLMEAGIAVIAPNFAGTNLDTPSLPPNIDAVFHHQDGYVILDVGGDDAGAIALAQFSKRLRGTPHDFYYVYSAYRYLTADSNDAVRNLRAIETASRMKVTAIIHNSNLGPETTAKTVEDALPRVWKLSDETELPVKFHTVHEEISCGLSPLLPVKLYIGPQWGL